MLKAAVSLAICSVLASGCDSPPPQNGSQGEPQLRLLGMLYGNYLAKHGGKAPANEDQWLKFLESQGRQLKSHGIENVESLLTSPRDGKKLVVLYGNKIVNDGPGGLPWVAYEQTSAAGNRYAIGARGVAQEMNPEQFSEVFGNGD